MSGLYKFFAMGGEETPVLRDLSLTIAPGTFTCVMGPSGSGKSTLLHIVAGLEQASAGRIELEGRDVGELGDRERTLLRRDAVGLVFQFFNLLPHMTVEENVALPLWIAGQDKAQVGRRVDELLALLGLDERRGHRAHQLSGGEMQRASIARSLAPRPRLLLADEPTGNLSAKAGEEVMDVLRQATDDLGQTVLLVTHNPRDAARADRVHFLSDGVISEDVRLEGPDLTPHQVHEALDRLGI